MTDFERALEDALNSPTLTEIERDGKLLNSKKTNLSGVLYEAYLYEYKVQKYIVVYKCTDLPNYFRNKECVRFETVIKDD